MTRKILEDKFLSKISYGPTTSQKAGYVPARVLVSSACFTSQNQEQAHDSIASENEGFFVALGILCKEATSTAFRMGLQNSH